MAGEPTVNTSTANHHSEAEMTDPLIILLALCGVAILLGLLALGWRLFGLRRALQEVRRIPLTGTATARATGLHLHLDATDRSTITIERLAMPRTVAEACDIAPPDRWRVAEDLEDPLEPPDPETAAAAVAFHDAWMSWAPAARPPTAPVSLHCPTATRVPDGTPVQVLWSVRIGGITRRGAITLHTGPA